MTLDLMPGSYAICRLDAVAAVPAWASRSAFSSVTRTADELSIVCASDHVPADVKAQRDIAGCEADLDRAVSTLRDAGHTVAIGA